MPSFLIVHSQPPGGRADRFAQPPMLDVSGLGARLDWGDTTFEVPPGDHRVTISVAPVAGGREGAVLTVRVLPETGTRVSVSRRTVFGRNPGPEEGVATVAVRDETLSLSKTHFEAAAETSGGWVLDRHSTNGTTIVREGQRIACPPGQRVPIRLGDAIEIGDRIVTVGGYA